MKKAYSTIFFVVLSAILFFYRGAKEEIKMFNEKKALDYILEIASKKGFTQVDLAYNIYDYSHFNRMCNGKESIHRKVLFKCAKKLGVSRRTICT